MDIKNKVVDINYIPNLYSKNTKVFLTIKRNTFKIKMTEINWIIYVNKNEKYATSHGLAPKYVVKYLPQYLKIYIIITLFSSKVCVANFLDTGSSNFMCFCVCVCSGHPRFSNIKLTPYYVWLCSFKLG